MSSWMTRMTLRTALTWIKTRGASSLHCTNNVCRNADDDSGQQAKGVELSNTLKQCQYRFITGLQDIRIHACLQFEVSSPT